VAEVFEKEHRNVLRDIDIEDMGRGDKFPPPVVFQDKQRRYWLADGFHRYHAAVGLELKVIECVVHAGELRDAILYSCGANAAHGLRRTNADKRQAVTKLINDDESAFFHEIADHPSEAFLVLRTHNSRPMTSGPEG
jgi:hypothetical protein